MGISLKFCLFSIAALSAPTFTGFAQSAKPPASIVLSAPRSVKVGSKIELDITMTNVSNRVVAGYFEESNHGEFNYDFDVRDSEGKPAPETCYLKAAIGLDRGSCPDFIMRGHKGIGDDLIKPGESLKGSAELSDLYDLKPGTYAIQLSWWEHRVRYRDPQKPRPPIGAVVVKSNTITLTVTP